MIIETGMSVRPTISSNRRVCATSSSRHWSPLTDKNHELLRIGAFQHSEAHRGVHGRDEDTLIIGATTGRGIAPKDRRPRQKAVD